MEKMTEQKTALQIQRRRFENMSDDEIETLNHECLVYMMERTNSNKFFQILEEFKKATSERAGFPVMERYISGEIAKRWKRQRQLLKDFKEMFM